MRTKTCRNCGSSDIEENTATGTSVCANCGIVCDEDQSKALIEIWVNKRQ